MNGYRFALLMAALLFAGISSVGFAAPSPAMAVEDNGDEGSQQEGAPNQGQEDC
ncbi:MAG: hypothetical protein WCC36_05275 [Gammaproteobacteria bacterium]